MPDDDARTAPTADHASAHRGGPGPRTALVTGAGRGIGRGCAIELGKRGASVIINYVSSKGPAEEVVKIIQGFNNGAKAISIQADVSKVSEINRLFAEAKEAFGRIDIVMSNSQQPLQAPPSSPQSLAPASAAPSRIHPRPRSPHPPSSP